jgi:Na+-transporting methylmalonyl-CoA/oxaloacetate decarboxylase gamma subunit
MRIVFSALSLLIVLAIIGVVAKKQLTSVPAPAGASTSDGVAKPTGTPKQQVDQFKQSVENAMQQSRPATDDTK